jgi:hypothetical protein
VAAQVEVRIEHVTINAYDAYDGDAEQAVIDSGLVCQNLARSAGMGAGVTFRGWGIVDCYGATRQLCDLVVAGKAQVEDATPMDALDRRGFEVRDALTELGATDLQTQITNLETGAALCDVITTQDDATFALSAGAARRQLWTGTGVLFWSQLPDATTLSVGQEYEFCNATPEFCGVRNSNDTTWHRVPPRAKCVCVLVDNTTAAGVWFSEVVACSEPSSGLIALNDFMAEIISSLVTGALPFYVYKGGTGSVSLGYSVDARQGEILLNASAVADFATISSSEWNVVLGSGCRSCGGELQISNLSDAVQEFVLRIGFGDNIAGGAHTRGVYLLYDRATHGDFFVCRNVDVAGNDTFVSAEAMTAGVNVFQIEIASDLSRTDFFVNKARISPVGGLLTHIPINGVHCINVGMTKSVGATNRHFKSDYLHVGSFPIVRR